MSFEQAVKLAKSHRKGTRQPIVFSTGSGFWPSIAWLDDCYAPYVTACTELNIAPLDAEIFYRRTVKTGHIPRHPKD